MRACKSLLGQRLIRQPTKSLSGKDFEYEYPLVGNMLQPCGAGSFATMNNIDDIETMTMTADEFVGDGEGIIKAELSESAEDLEEAAGTSSGESCVVF